ncbi:MAG TPA: TonB-dependent receptor [Terriglobales bacterium]|jgi:Carboxypeptidase regulatory-like domain/TonB dependent receptor|nr:TonB-dependent receptor [Terriglobales bacterium]
MQNRRIAMFLVCLLALTSIGLAQVDTGTIAGSIHDAQGAGLPSATVTFVDLATNASSKTQTDGIGNYASPPLRPGNYKVMVEAQGFKTQTRSTVLVQVQDRVRIDFDMAVGAVSENVVVTAETPVIQSETSSLGEVVAAKQIEDLPLNGRDYVQLATLTTGVVRTSSGTNGNTGGSSTGGLNSFVANGTRGTLNNFILDGIDNNSNDNGGVVLRTNVDAIQEFKLQTNSYSAEFGRSGGAVVNAVLKSGTNGFHGSLFEFFRNAALDARDYFENPGSKKASFKQNQFGGTIGGPIVKDKLFFFGDYQGTRIRNPLTFSSVVPQPDERSGNFSALGEPIIFDPQTGLPFPGNIIPADRIDPIAQAYMNLYPDANNPDGTRYVISPIEQDGINQWDVRMDYNASQKNQFFVRYSESRRKDVRPAPLPGLANGGDSFTGNGHEDTDGASIGYTRTFTPKTINELRVGFNYVHIRRGVPVSGNAFPPTELQVPGVPNDPRINGLTLFQPGGYRRVGDPSFAPTILASQERQITDVLTLVRGAHTIKLGAEMRWSQFNISQEAAPRGRFFFNGQFTSNPAGDGPDETSGSSLADMLLGLPNQARISTIIFMYNRQHVPSVFAQDDWKVTRKLTLNLGIRYDYFSPITEAHNRQSNFDYATGALVQAGVNGASDGLISVDKGNFSPRVGFAWTPRDSANLVVRGAYGVFYSGQEIRTAAPLQLAYNLPFFYEPVFQSDGTTPVITVSQGFPPLSPDLAINPSVTSVDKRLHTPYYQSWNLAVQQALPGAISLELAYAGSKGTHLQVVTDLNQDPVPADGDVQARRPYPFFGPFTSIQNRGNSTYHSFQAKAEKHLSHGLYFLSAFTWSKAINDLPEICCSAPFPQNSYDLSAEKGLADFHQKLRWVFSFDYELPYGSSGRHVDNRFLDAVFGGWHVGGIYTLATGFPFSAVVNNDFSNTGSQGLPRADQLRDGNLDSGDRSPNRWFDVNAFTSPADLTFGNARRNNLIGPGQNVFDGSLRKVFKLTEAQRLEFRAEFFNALNHPNFSQPDNFIDDGPGAAGVISSIAIPMRQIQFGLKYTF